MKYLEEDDGRKEKKVLPATLSTGAIALVFLIIGFQAALFIHRAAVVSIVNKRDRPDTVYVLDEELAGKVLADPAVRMLSGAAGGMMRDDAAVAEGKGSAAAGGRDAAVAVGRYAGKKETGGNVPGKGWTSESSSMSESKSSSGSGTGTVIVRKDSYHSPEAKSVYRANAARQVESFRFNPNTVSLDDLMRLGFSLKQAASIVNYREKGGRFRRKTDFARSYVVADSVYERLEPYIEIPDVDLNLADSADFDALLPGIGGYFAARMVEYRRKLGGSYSYKEQLMDIWNFTEEKFAGLSDLVCVDSANVRPYPLWTLPEDSLRLHPYIGAYAAHGVVVFRENNPVSAWSVDALAKAGVLRREDAARLSRCIIRSP